MKIIKFKKSISLFVICVLGFHLIFAQNHDTPRIGFIASTATIQYGVPTSKLVSPTWYLTLRGEAFIEKNVSIAGILDISLPKKFKLNDISENYSLLFGANYHLIKKHFDGYIGIQPGLSFSKTTIVDYNLKDKNKYVFSPLISSVVGARYYVGWVAHVFTSVSYLYGIQLSNQTNLPMSEFRIAAGVGLNFNVFKPKS